MKCRVAPYEGDKPYIFISYCHATKDKVYPMIERMAQEGFRIWYDSGIHPGDDWAEIIADKLLGCEVFIPAISKKSCDSLSCKNEMSMAVTENKKILSVILEDFVIPGGIRLQINGSSFVRAFDHEDPEKFYEALCTAPCCQVCKGEKIVLSEEPKLESEKPTVEPEKPPVEPEKPPVEPEKPPVRKPKVIVKPKPKTFEAAEEKQVNHEPDTGDYEPTVVEKYDEGAAVDIYDEGTVVDIYDEGTVVERNDEVSIASEDDFNKTVIIREKPVIAYIVRTVTGEIFELRNTETTMGRAKPHAQLVFKDESNTISKAHADIFVYEDKFYLRDKKSGNGTYLRDKKLEPDESAVLNDVDMFVLANEVFLFVRAEKKHFVEKMREDGKLCILIAELTQEWRILDGETLPLDRSHQWKGGVLADRHVHRNGEAELLFEDGKYCLHDINSANGVKINMVRMNHGDKKALKNGNIISISGTEFTYKELEINNQEK